MADLINNEILAGMKKMNSDGFYPTTFAYPYGAHNGYLDQTLLKYFKSVRALNGSTDYSKSLVPTNKNSVLFGIGLDKSSKLTNNDIDKLLQSAKNHNNCVVFVAHDINTGSNLSISKERLKHILDYVNNNGLKFYTAAELSD